MLQRPTTRAPRIPSTLRPLAALLLALTGASTASAQSGVLDPTFGSGGVVIAPIGSGDDFGQAVALQADDRIVVAGYSVAVNDDFSVARFDLDGDLDPTFGGSGKVIVPIGSDVDRAFAAAVQSDQKIVVAGFRREGGSEAFALARFNPNGSLDTDFDGDGKVVTAIGTLEDVAQAVAMQDDDKIVVAGFSRSGANKDVALVRYNPNGSLDTTFSGDGKVTLGIGTGNDEALAVAIDDDDRIVVAGYAGTARDMFVARFTPAGSLDPTFNGGTGLRLITFGTGDESGQALALQSDGSILVAGYARIGTVDNVAVARVDENGLLDATLDGDGKLTTAIGTFAQGRAIAVDANDRFVVAGFGRFAGSDDVAVVRYNADGSLDTAFGGTGIVALPLGGSGSDEGNAVALQSDAKVLVAGMGRTGSAKDFALLRILVDDCGNGTLDAGEQCDGGAIIEGDCCTSACTFLPASTVCRAVADDCDLEEACTGSSGACPVDLKKPDGDGDDVCDEQDICPVDPDPDQHDGDDDGLGDECDPCTNGVAIGKPKLKLTKFTTGPGDDTLTFTGELDFALAPTLDPLALGARLILEDGLGDVLFDVAVPAGAYNPLTRTGWTVNGAATSFTFRSTTPVGGLLNQLKLSKSAARPDLIKIRATGKKGAYAQSSLELPLTAIVVLDAPTAATGECGEVHYLDAPLVPSCAFNGSGSTLQCK